MPNVASRQPQSSASSSSLPFLETMNGTAAGGPAKLNGHTGAAETHSNGLSANTGTSNSNGTSHSSSDVVASPVSESYDINGANGAVQPPPPHMPFLRKTYSVPTNSTTSSVSSSSRQNTISRQNSLLDRLDTSVSSVSSVSTATSRLETSQTKSQHTATTQPSSSLSASLYSRISAIDPLVPSPIRNFHFDYEDAYADTPNGQYQRENIQHRSSDGFPRIGRPVELLRPSYDVVVIGSGYGGGVAASRMARGNQSVCVLERGKERWPGEFPYTLLDAGKYLHVSGLRESIVPGSTHGKVMKDSGDPTELYHLILGEGQNVFVGNGLGGTSLLNANVFLPADHGTLGLNEWPEEIRKHPGCLDKYYQRARDVLQPEQYPDDLPNLPKMDVLKKQAELLGHGDKFSKVFQTTRFYDGMNSTGIAMRKSKLTGQDSTGLNDGSKNTTLVTYISDAWNWGAEIFCECEVRYIRKHPREDGYLIYFAWHGSKRGAFKSELHTDLMWVHAKKCVFMGAGSLGTTEILLRSQEMGLDISNGIGTSMSGNGDILSFGYNTNENVNAMGREVPEFSAPIGPTISGIIDLRDQPNPRDGFVIEEGAVPSALVPLMEIIIGVARNRSDRPSFSYYEHLRQLGSSVLNLAGGAYYTTSRLQKTQVYLVMSHDTQQAQLSLKEGNPVLAFRGVGHLENVQKMHKILREATEKINGTYVDSPFYADWGEEQITVHPIGGAIMSHDGTGSHGVTNHYGQVFKNTGSEVHKGIVCVDASVIPTALGANPFATITALAERSVETVAADFGIKIDYETRNGPISPYAFPRVRWPAPKKLTKVEDMILKAKSEHRHGLTFSEVMSGYIHIGDEIKDYSVAYATGKGLCEEARFFLNARTWDVEKTMVSPEHRSLLTGSVSCALPGSPFMVNQGDLQSFTKDVGQPDTKNLVYDFDMISTTGDLVHFHGWKTVDSESAFDPLKFWRETTTLKVELSVPGDRSRILGRGILHLHFKDFIPELLSMAPSAQGMFGKISVLSKYASWFARKSASVFFEPFTWQQYPKFETHGMRKYVQHDLLHMVKASDGIESVVKMWSPKRTAPGRKPPTVLMIAGAAVDDEIFNLPTVDVNAIRYFQSFGWRIYTVTHRIGKSAANEKYNPTTFDARLDIAAAVKYIMQRQSEKFYVIAHCMGSVALSMGLLDGSIPTKSIKGITCSQTFMNPRWAPLNMLKAKSPVPLDTVYKRVAGSWYPINSSRNDAYVQQGINQMLRLYPVGGRAELCRSVSCHRCSFVFGRCWDHDNLNDETHGQVDRFFSGVNMGFLHHAMHFGEKGYATNNSNMNLVTPDNLERIRGIPIFLFSGANNCVLSPEATTETLSMLQDHFSEQIYKRTSFPNYGHLDCWMGKNAAKDIFPEILEQMEQVMKLP